MTRTPTTRCEARRRAAWPTLADAVDDDGHPLVPAASPESWWGLGRRLARHRRGAADRAAGGSVRVGGLGVRPMPASVVPQPRGQGHRGDVDRAGLRLDRARAGRGRRRRRACQPTLDAHRRAARCGLASAAVRRATGRRCATTTRRGRRCSASWPGTPPIRGSVRAPRSSSRRGRRRRRDPRPGRPDRARRRRPAWSSSISRPASTRRARRRCKRIRSSASISSRFAKARSSSSSTTPGGAELVQLRQQAWGSVKVSRKTPLGPDDAWVDDLVTGVALGIREERFPARPNDSCDRCRFRTSCPARDEGGQVVP